MYRLQGWLGLLPRRPWHVLSSAVALLVATAGAVRAAVDEKTLQLTPARVGYVEGDVSFWRPGAGDWEAASVNIPLAAGDALATREGRFELQIGPQDFLRAADQTQLTVKSQEPDFLQIEVNQGSVVLDLRQLPAGHVVQITTPQGAMTARANGFYRVDVGGDSTRLTVRRAGRASLAPAGGQAVQVATGESVTVTGGAVGQLNVVAAPAFDDWDRWNYARADAVLAAPRSAAVSSEIYGAADLDRYGSWRSVPPYGRVWVPYSVPVGWAPYSDGRWLWDPVYGYSWVDYAPWGWAPYHYGRWIYTGYWAWAPGPVVFGPVVYAPALVSFFTPAVSVSIGIGGPFIGWTALGWGEPLVPWWGGVGFMGVPCWYGWGGPRVVNNIVINNYDTVNANQIKLYRNAQVPGGLVGVPKNQFGGTDVQRVRLASLASSDVKPLRNVTRTALGGPSGLHATGKDGLPALAAGGKPGPQVAAFDRLRGGGAQAAVERATTAGTRGGVTQFSRRDAAPAAGLGSNTAPPKSGTESAAFARLRGTSVEASRAPLPKSGMPALGSGASAAPEAKGAGRAPFDRLREASAAPSPALLNAGAPDNGMQRAPFERLRGGGSRAVPKSGMPSTGSSAAASAPAPKPGGQGAPFERLRGGGAPATRQLSRQPSATITGGAVAADRGAPPLGGMYKARNADAYRRLQGGTATTSRAPRALSYARAETVHAGGEGAGPVLHVSCPGARGEPQRDRFGAVAAGAARHGPRRPRTDGHLRAAGQADGGAEPERRRWRQREPGRREPRRRWRRPPELLSLSACRGGSAHPPRLTRRAPAEA
jgi:hypothetical protein